MHEMEEATAKESSRVVEEILKEFMEIKKKETPKAEKEVIFKTHKKPGARKAVFGTSFNSVFKTNIENDFPVTVLRAINPNIEGFVPKVNKNYVIQVKEAAAIVLAIECGDKILLTGPTGSGKSTLIEQICARLNRPLIRVNMDGTVEPSMILGSLTAKDGSTLWNNGPVTEAVMYGAVCMIDEWELMNPSTAFCLQALLEDNGSLFLKEMPGEAKDKLLIPHKDFRLVFTGNTLGMGDDSGQYAGTNVHNIATIDRFQTTVCLDYLSASHESKVIEAHVEALTPNTIKNMLSVASFIRVAHSQGNLSLSFSPRTLINWGKKAVLWEDMEEGFRYAFLNKLPQEQKKIADELYFKVFARHVVNSKEE